MWEEKNNQLECHFTFKDFKAAFTFISLVAIEAEKAEHHPTIVNTYNKVSLFLTTHDANSKITDKDYTLASTIELIYVEYCSKNSATLS